MMRLRFAVLLLICTSCRLSAQEEGMLFEAGNKAYQDGNYAEAIEKYEAILDASLESWQLYYNLGNAYYKAGNIARSVLNYERAKRLEPKNEDIDYNLQLARLATVDRIEVLPELFLTKWFSTFANLLSLQALGWLTIVIYFCLMVIIIMKVLGRIWFLGRFRAIIVAISLVLVILAPAFLHRVYESETRAEAIILTDKIDVKSAPDDAGTNVFTLHAGVKVEVHDSSLSWLRIRLADGKTGWIKESALELI